MCQSFCLQQGVSASGPGGVSAHLPLGRHPPRQTPPGQTPPGQTPPGTHLPWADTPWADSPLPSACWDTHTPLPSAYWDTHTPCPVYAGIRSTSGRYASHWNAIFFNLNFKYNLRIRYGQFVKQMFSFKRISKVWKEVQVW